MLGSPSVSKRYLGYCSPVSGRTTRAGQKTDESWVVMRGWQNYIPEPSFHPLPARYAAVNPFLKSLTCRWCLLGFRVVTPSYFSRNSRKQQRIAGLQFVLFYQKNPPYSGRKKKSADAWAHHGLCCHPQLFVPGAPHLWTLVGTCSRASPQQLSSLPASPGLENFTSTPFPEVMNDTGYQDKWGLLRAGSWLLGIAGR